MAKCSTCVFHEKDKRMDNVWLLANYNEAKTMRLSKRMENARGTIGHVQNKTIPLIYPHEPLNMLPPITSSLGKKA